MCDRARLWALRRAADQWSRAIFEVGADQPASVKTGDTHLTRRARRGYVGPAPHAWAWPRRARPWPRTNAVPRISSSAPESLASIADDGRGHCAEQPGPARAALAEPASDPASLRDARDQRHHRQPQHHRRRVALEAVHGELEPALDDLGELIEAAGAKHGAGEVRVAPAARSAATSAARAPAAPRSGARAAAARRPGRRRRHRGADRDHDRRADVGAEPAGGEGDDGERRGRREGEGRRPAERPWAPTRPGRRRWRSGPAPRRRLELVADPVEARPRRPGWGRSATARSGASRRPRRRRSRTPRPRRRSPARRTRERAAGDDASAGRADADDQSLGQLARLERRGEQQQARAGRRPPRASTAKRHAQAAAPERDPGERGERHPDQEV